jgi:hypothetical protein
MEILSFPVQNTCSALKTGATLHKYDKKKAF